MAGAGAGAGTGWEQRRWSLQGTYARVTGDVKGLGHAVVEELAALGASLRHLILSRTGEANQQSLFYVQWEA